jgi:hypothetical protein
MGMREPYNPYIKVLESKKMNKLTGSIPVNIVNSSELINF